MRSQGQVRFIRLSSGLQLTAVGVGALLLTAWCVSIAALAFDRWNVSSSHAALLDREAYVVTAESRVEKYRSGLDDVTADLVRRQKFIEQMVQAHIGDLPEGEAISNDPSDAVKAIEKVSAVVPEAAGLARIEAEQLAFVDRLTRYADRRADAASDAILKLGLNPRSIMVRSSRGEGGPLLRLATSRDGSLDPRFQRLGVSLARMEALENGLASIPQFKPANVAYVSSSYGFRSDPFTGGPAFHAGLDFPGPMGSPIFAAAKGTVTFAGYRPGYGNCIEISHGNGLMTRYGHLLGFRTRVGEEVEPGTVIAAMGSTGRSTGPHLHFEVRVNGQAVNPRPFLETAVNVKQEAL